MSRASGHYRTREDALWTLGISNSRPRLRRGSVATPAANVTDGFGGAAYLLVALLAGQVDRGLALRNQAILGVTTDRRFVCGSEE